MRNSQQLLVTALFLVAILPTQIILSDDHTDDIIDHDVTQGILDHDVTEDIFEQDETSN